MMAWAWGVSRLLGPLEKTPQPETLDRLENANPPVSYQTVTNFDYSHA
jgi:hypothetical protein